MNSNAKKIEADVMTPERLRAYWFGKDRVPFWNYDPSQLTMGLEIEYFIAKVDAKGFKLATKDQYFAVIGHLISDFGYTDHKLKDQPGRVSKDTKRGFIAIKPDFAWHILEIALPPRYDISEIRQLLEETFRDLDAALAKVGLERLDMSCLPDVPETMDLVELDRLSTHVDLLKKTCNQSTHAVPVFPALIAATHIHANVFDERALAFLPDLYGEERKYISRFTRVQTFRGVSGNSHRTRFYEDSLGCHYLLRTFPSTVPKSVADYCWLYNDSPKIFPNDLFFSSRDMTYIRPTRYGTFEFRSACSFKNIEDIIEIVHFRKNQIIQCLVPKERGQR